jgi:hypothetical protein
MYDVVVLLTHELTHHDAARLVEIHRRSPGPVAYHLLVSSNPQDVLESALAAIGVGPGDLYGSSAVRPPGRRGRAEGGRRTSTGVTRLCALGHVADATIGHGDPIRACRHLAVGIGADEVVVMTRSRHPDTQPPELDLVAGLHFGVRGVRHLTQSRT